MNNCLNRLSIGILETGILNINSIQKRSQVLVLDHCSLLDSRANLRYLLQIDSLQCYVVLLLLFLRDYHSFWGVDPLVYFESQEVLYLEGLG